MLVLLVLAVLAMFSLLSMLSVSAFAYLLQILIWLYLTYAPAQWQRKKLPNYQRFMASLEQLDEREVHHQLQCRGACKNLVKYNNPVRLPCGEVICQRCLADLIHPLKDDHCCPSCDVVLYLHDEPFEAKCVKMAVNGAAMLSLRFGCKILTALQGFSTRGVSFFGLFHLTGLFIFLYSTSSIVIFVHSSLQTDGIRWWQLWSRHSLFGSWCRRVCFALWLSLGSSRVWSRVGRSSKLCKHFGRRL